MGPFMNWNDLLGWVLAVALLRESGRTKKGYCPKALR